ncbi:MAG: hypothetical protein ACRD26_19685, partial [Vicinamibacterales bacterium]
MTVHTVPAVVLNTAPASRSSSELLVIPVFEQDDLGEIDGLDAATGGEAGRAQRRGELRGTPYELLFAETGRGGWR